MANTSKIDGRIGEKRTFKGFLDGNGCFEHTGQLHTTRAHEFDVGLPAGVAVIESALFIGYTLI